MMKKKYYSYLFTAITLLILAIKGIAASPIYSSRLIHRFAGKVGNQTTPLQVRMLLGSDLNRQRLKLGAQNQVLVAVQGGQTYDYGNPLGWLHYAWIDIGTPSKSFLVALDTGSDMSWLPCDCKQCAPLSYNVLDRELNEYNPSRSNSSKRVACSHELCSMGPACKTPNDHCPYTVNYESSDTSSSGFLFEDKLLLASAGGNKVQGDVQASIIIGCGSKQSGQYLEGISPDGLMGLGPGPISIPSLLAKSGLVSRSFSFCYDKSYSGTLFFGDQGPASQRSTSFLPFNKDPNHYAVEVETFCVGKSCLSQTGYRTLIDTGSSFTYIPRERYELVAAEFHKQVNTKKFAKEGFDYCYQSSSDTPPNLPSLKLIFSANQSFVIENPILSVGDGQGLFYCLAVYPVEGDIGIIGQNFLMGYRMVFDWEKLKLGWSISNCQDIVAGGEARAPPPQSDATPTPLPTDQQRQNGNGHAIPPAVAGRARSSTSWASPLLPFIYKYCIFSSAVFLSGILNI